MFSRSCKCGNASEGDIIDVICEGTVSWSEQINLSGGKTLRGGGSKGNSGTGGSWPLIINVTSIGDTSAIYVTNSNNQAVNRVTGFKFQGSGNPYRIIKIVGVGTGKDGKGAFRIDNNYFDQTPYASRLTETDGSTGKLTGLFDHNVFYYTEAGVTKYALNSYYNSYRGSSSTCYGYDSLHRAVGFGTDDFVFWEDNYMANTGLETAGVGSRIVLRHNEITIDLADGSMGILDGHGADTSGWHACGVVANEFYNNTITGTQPFSQLVDMRGGKWMVHNNSTHSGYLQINEYRLAGPEYLEWKACSGTWCCDTPKCDIQAPVATDFAACYPLPNQVQSTYIWNNLKNGVNMTPIPVDGAGGLVDTYVALNRDYWMPSYGTEAARPTSCITGTYYGATDSGKLWKCTDTNIWTLQYTPYTYPHPLRVQKFTGNIMIGGAGLFN